MKAIVIFASSSQSDVPQLGASDRAALGLATARFAGAAQGLCPNRDALALNYGAAAGVATLATLPFALDTDFDIALIGLGALTEYGDQIAGILAERKGATLAFDVLDFHFDGDSLHVVKDVGRGNREEWIVSGPAVLVISSDAVRPPYVSSYRRQIAARKRSNAAYSAVASTTSALAQWEGVRPRPRIGNRAKSMSGQAEDRMSAAFGITGAAVASFNDRVIIADAATCARHLLRYLAHHAFVPATSTSNVADEPIASERGRFGKQPAAAERFRNALVSQGAARGPRTAHDSKERISRRPRSASIVAYEIAENVHGRRCPRWLGQPMIALARRPRLLHHDDKEFFATD